MRNSPSREQIQEILVASALPELGGGHFLHNEWGASGYLSFSDLYDLGASPQASGRAKIRKYAIGWCFGDRLQVRPKPDTIAVLCSDDGERFWFHLSYDEAFYAFCPNAA